MRIFELSKSFPKEETYSLTEFAVHRVRFVRISPKRGANVGMSRIYC